MADPIPSAVATPQQQPPVSIAGRWRGQSLARAMDAVGRPLVILGVFYVALRVFTFLEVDPRAFPDTGVYDKVAAAPLLSEGFLAGGRPPTVPLAYKLLVGEQARVAGQLLLSIACWTWLAASVAASLRSPWLRLGGFGAVLALSLSDEVQLWDAALLSESIALSLTAALAASWLAVVRRPSGRNLALMLGVSALWTFSRDPHAYLLAAVAAALAVSLAVPGESRRPRALSAVALAAIAAASLVSAGAGYPRWLYPAQNLVALRIAADPVALEHFERAGMPVDARFIALAERQRETGVRPFEHPGRLYYEQDADADFMPFQLWLAEHGRGAYGGYLLSHPTAVVEGVEPALEATLDPQVERYAASAGPMEAPVVSGIAFGGGPWLMAAWLFLAAALAAAAAIRGVARREWALPIAMIAVSAPFALFVYHAGAQELDRHVLVASLLLRLGVLLLALLALDALAAAVRAQRAATGPSAARCR